MKLKTKKLIAREVLLLSGSAILASFIFLSTYPYNWYYQSNSEHIYLSIKAKEKEADSLCRSYDDKKKHQDWFYDENKKRYDVTVNFSSPRAMWERIAEIYRTDSIEYKYRHVWQKELIDVLNEIGFHNVTDFKKFVSQNLITAEDDSNKVKSNQIKEELSSLRRIRAANDQKIIDLPGQVRFGFRVFIILLFILYPLRFLFILLRWSLLTLRQTTE